MRWAVCLVPRAFWIWAWNNTTWTFGAWTPHVLGRVLGVDGHRVVEKPK